MKNLFLVLTILNLTISCTNHTNYGSDKFITAELKGLRSRFLKMYQADTVRYDVDYNRLNYLDKEFDKIKLKIDEGGDIKTQLMEFKKAIKDKGEFFSSDSDAVNEMDYLIANCNSLDQSVLKQHLQFIEFAYWSSHINKETKYQLIFDRIQVYQTKSKTDNNGQFSTSLIPVALNVTHLYEMNIGDSIKGNKLLGKIDRLNVDFDTTSNIRYSNYSTSKTKKGYNEKPGQFITRVEDGSPDTINFRIRFNTK